MKEYTLIAFSAKQNPHSTAGTKGHILLKTADGTKILNEVFGHLETYPGQYVYQVQYELDGVLIAFNIGSFNPQ